MTHRCERSRHRLPGGLGQPRSTCARARSPLRRAIGPDPRESPAAPRLGSRPLHRHHRLDPSAIATITASTRPSFHLPGNSNGTSRIVEAVITKARNGLAINFPDPAMRRRDPDAMVIGDNLPTDKPTYDQRFGETFDGLAPADPGLAQDAGTRRDAVLCGHRRAGIWLAADCAASGSVFSLRRWLICRA
jgi:hypothetical protein